MNDYANRLTTVNRRVEKVDQRLDKLYTRVGLIDLLKLINADLLMGYSYRLSQCQKYLYDTARDFVNAESSIQQVDPLNFLPQPSIPSSVLFELFENKPGGIIKPKTLTYVDEVNSVADGLTWLEEFYEKFPREAKLALDVFLPDSLKEAYTLTSGILQGDLTFEDGWEVAKSILTSSKKISKLTIVCEAFDYAFKYGDEKSAEMEAEIFDQLREGDVLGAVFDGAEGFVDTIIGGSIFVLGNAAGDAVDNVIDDIPIVKGINMLTEFGTGLLGWNEGDGYSVGGLIGHVGEKVSDGIDAVTDVVTDVTDFVTDGVTGAVKGGINWVKSWFD